MYFHNFRHISTNKMLLTYLIVFCVLLKTTISEELPVSTEYCGSVVENHLTWPKTTAGEEAYPQEYCFKEDGLRLSRLCISDSNGAHWAEITDTCTTPAQTSISQELLTLIGQFHNQTIWDYTFYDEIVDVSTHYSQFNAFDVYLTGTILNSAFRLTTDVYASQVIKVFDNIFNIGRGVLIEAETQMRAADAWLSTLQYLQNHPVVNNYNYVEANYGLVITQAQSPVTGALVQNSGSKRTLSTVGYAQSLDYILETENLESAVWIDPPAQSFSPKISFVFYWNHGNSLFADESVPADNVNTVIGVWAQNSVNPVQVIQKIDSDTSIKNVQCAHWEEGNVTIGKWKIDGEFRIQKLSFICTFEKTGTFALILEPAKAVTDVLQEVLESSASTIEVLSRLLQVSSRYDEFGPAELGLVGKIFRKVSSRSDGNLELLDQVLDNLRKIDAEIFAEVEVKENVAEAILYYADVILKKY